MGLFEIAIIFISGAGCGYWARDYFPRRKRIHARHH
jgi:hypothetical protein